MGETVSLDLEALKLRPNAEGIIKTAPLLKTIKVLRPGKTDYFRIRPGAEWTLKFPIFSMKSGSDSEMYLVMPEFQMELYERNLLQPVMFHFGIFWGSNILFLSDVGIKLGRDGGLNPYHKSRLEAYEIAKTKWISISANLEGGFYTIVEAKSKIPEPIWPTTPANIGEAVELAFRDNVIDSADHPVLKKLRGEI